MALADYLAKNYLSADPKPSKKRKRKAAAADAPAGITITDDDVLPQPGPANGDPDDDDDDPMIVGTVPSSGLNAPKKSKWLRIGASAPTDAEQVAADAILASAQAESAARQRAEADEDGPQIVDNNDDDDTTDNPSKGPTMSSGAAAGLQTAAQVTAAVRKKEAAEKAAMAQAGLDASALTHQTVYRDASGRAVNVQAARAEAARKEVEKEERAREEVRSRLGEVQLREREERKRALEDARTMAFARGADDRELNEELKSRERWNDPMAKLVKTDKGTRRKGGEAKGKGKGKAGKTYEGAAEPNRYGIRPGWRWDGVDRGNGFERKWFAARNRARDREELEYAWQLDE